MENSYTRYLEIQEEAMENKTPQTANGMSTNESSLDDCVDFFFSVGAMRGKDKVRLIEKFSKAYSNNSLIATKLLFWARDVRGGAGERQIFRDILSHLVKLSPVVVKKNISLIPEYGRWDDVLVLLGTELEEETLKLIETALQNEDGLCAKWMPRKGEAFNKLRKLLRVTPKQLRKLLVNLTNVVETKMCANEWDKIDYSKLPSLASSRYQKTFSRNDKEGYGKYMEDLMEGKTKVNSGALYPYDITKSLYCGGEEIVCQKQWESLPNYMEDNNDIVLPMVDVSGSMQCPAGNNSNVQCMDVALSLGLYISERNEGTFKDCFLTFSSNPELQYLQGTLKERLSQLRSSDWGMNTNLEATFNLLLRQAQSNSVPQDKMPTKILILSDMEFDQATGNDWDRVPDFNPSAIEMIRKDYEQAGYKMPGIIFWNINSRGDNFPVKKDELNTALVSGFSPSILKSILSAKDITPYSVMMETIDGVRYRPITV
tara:strand:+ start:232 stop:1689 length:1458 start_codon:yes stop_codon:yes gene_type:complete